METQNGIATLENVIHIHFLSEPAICISRYLSNRKWKHMLHENVCVNVRSSIIRNSKKLEATLISLNWWINKQIALSYHRTILSNKKWWDINMCNSMGESQTLRHVKEAKHKRECAVWLHLQKILDKTKLYWQKAVNGCISLWNLRRGFSAKGMHKESLGRWKCSVSLLWWWLHNYI